MSKCLKIELLSILIQIYANIPWHEKAVCTVYTLYTEDNKYSINVNYYYYQ